MATANTRLHTNNFTRTDKKNYSNCTFSFVLIGPFPDSSHHVTGTDIPAVTKLLIFRECLLLFSAEAFVFVFIYKSKDKVIHTYKFMCCCVLSLSSREHLRTECEEECLDLKGGVGEYEKL